MLSQVGLCGDAEQRPSLSGRVLGYDKKVRLTVVDSAREEDFVYVTIRFPYYDGEKKSYFLDKGRQVRLPRKDDTTFETVYLPTRDGIVHGTAARVEYVFNLLPKHHNDLTRSVVTEVTFAFH